MAILEDLTEEEAYLWSIISDSSGLDLGEFCIVDELNDHVDEAKGQDGSYCFRAWPFQWPWWRDDSPRVIDQGSRSLGKSWSIKFRAMAFAFNYPGSEMLITAPEGVHLDAITDAIEGMILNNQIPAEMIVKGRQGFKHRPFVATFQNGAHIIGRIPQRDGRGVKGCVSRDALILTKRGLIPAGDVVVGDEAWSHLCRWSPVIQVDSFEDEAYRVTGGGSKPQIVNSRHRFYGRRNLPEGAGLSGLTWSTLDRLEGFYWAADVGDGRLVCFPVESARPTGTVEAFANIVTEDHSYVADGIVSHNTHPVLLELDEACFPGETLILTSEGHKPIAEVSVGDKVLTHRGRWRSVLNVWDRGERSVVSVKGQGHPGIVVTPNHRFYARRVDQWKDTKNRWGPYKLRPAEWIQAEVLEGGYWAAPLSVPPVEAIPTEIIIPRAKTGKNRFDINVLDQNSSFFWAVGLYLAEGSLSSSGGPGGPLNKVTWSVHVDEIPEVQRHLTAAGWHSFVQPVANTSKGVNIVVSSTGLCSWLLQFGRGCRGKRIPIWVHGLPDVSKQSFLEGLVFGDGHTIKDDKYAPGRWVLSSTSRSLIFDVRLLAVSLGRSVGIYWVPPAQRTIRGKSVNGGASFTLASSTNGHGFTDDGFLFTKVKSVTPAGVDRVYDLEVEEDHSFVAEGIVVHNSDYPEAGWKELIETVNKSAEKGRWRAHGVTRGMGDDSFYKYTQPDSGWKVHHLPAMYRPTWSDEEREEKIALYTSREDPDYRRNVLGQHGDATSPLFDLHRLGQILDDDRESEYNTSIYYDIKFDEGVIRRKSEDLSLVLDPPSSHVSKFSNFWMGMDVGFTTDPSVIVIFAEELKNSKSPSKLRLLSKITMKGVQAGYQAEAMLHLYDIYRPLGFSMDSTGVGLPLFQIFQMWARDTTNPERAELSSGFLDVLKPYNFSQSIVVEFDEAGGESESEIKRNVKEWATDCLRVLVDEERLVLPYDQALMSEFRGQSWRNLKDTRDQYGRKRAYSKGYFHTLDATRMAVLGWKQRVIDLYRKEREVTFEAPPLVFVRR